jgi:hypothetical protein
MDSTLEAPVDATAVSAESEIAATPDEERLAQLAEELRDAIRRKIEPRE